MKHKTLVLSNLNKIHFLLMICSLAIMISSSSCNRSSPESMNNNKIMNHLLLSGSSTNLSKTIAEMIDKSDIRSGGYVLIIPTPDLAKDNNAKSIKNQFYRKKIMAIHILNLNPVAEPKNTDLLAIENAKIICFVGDKSYTLRRLVKNPKIKDALKGAYEAGTLISAIGSSSAVFGQDYLWVNKNPKPKSERLVMESGLGLCQNLIIDEDSILIKNKEFLVANYSNNDFLYLGISSDASTYINGKNGVVLGGSNINLFSPPNEFQKLELGARFKVEN